MPCIQINNIKSIFIVTTCVPRHPVFAKPVKHATNSLAKIIKQYRMKMFPAPDILAAQLGNYTVKIVSVTLDVCNTLFSAKIWLSLT